MNDSELQLREGIKLRQFKSMICSETIKIKKTENFDNTYIENELSKLYKSVIRWAIVDIGEEITVSVSYDAD